MSRLTDALNPGSIPVSANRFAFQSAIHGCMPYEKAAEHSRLNADAHYPSGSRFGACDDWGCTASSHTLPAFSYGPGARFRIDTNAPFRVTVAFPLLGQGFLSDMRIVLNQAGREVALTTSCTMKELAHFTHALDAGMTLVARGFCPQSWFREF